MHKDLRMSFHSCVMLISCYAFSFSFGSLIFEYIFLLSGISQTEMKWHKINCPAYLIKFNKVLYAEIFDVK